MRTYKGLWDRIISFDNLYSAYLKARKSKRYRRDVLLFSSKLEENLLEIRRKLISGEWMPGKHRQFYVYDPKKRLISAPPFEDRIVHHALVNVVEPLFERRFIYDSYACRKEKGVHKAVLRLQSFLRRAKRHSNRVFVLKADISKYFPSIDHNVLISILKRTIGDRRAMWLCERIIKHKCVNSEGKGIPVGALTSQLFANVYLDQLDHFIKDRLGVKFYVRYMDDFIILAGTKAYLWNVLEKIKGFLERLKLKLNPKTSVFPAERGVDFAGYRTWATHILPRKRNVKKFRRKAKWMMKAYALGKIDLSYIKPRLMSFLGYMKHCYSNTTVRFVLEEFRVVRD